MKLEAYNPKGQEVLFVEIREEKSAGGIYLPSADFNLTSYSDVFENEKLEYEGSKSKLGKYKIVKTGKLVAEIKVGDVILLRTGVQPEVIELDDKRYFQVMEAYIIGYERE